MLNPLQAGHKGQLKAQGPALIKEPNGTRNPRLPKHERMQLERRGQASRPNLMYQTRCQA